MALNSATNFVRQDVGSAVGTTDPETIDVQDASEFADPSVSQYDIVIWDAGTHVNPDQDPDVEVLTVTGRDTTADTLTCARGQQGTTNTSHPSTSDVIVTPLAEADFKSIATNSVDIGGSNATREKRLVWWMDDSTSVSTTNTGLTPVDAAGPALPSPNDQADGTMTPVTRLSGFLKIADASATATLQHRTRRQNAADEGLGSVTTTNTSYTYLQTSWVDLTTAESPGEPISFNPHIKTSNGSHSAAVLRAVVEVGLQP